MKQWKLVSKRKREKKIIRNESINEYETQFIRLSSILIFYDMFTNKLLQDYQYDNSEGHALFSIS